MSSTSPAGSPGNATSITHPESIAHGIERSRYRLEPIRYGRFHLSNVSPKSCAEVQWASHLSRQRHQLSIRRSALSACLVRAFEQKRRSATGARRETVCRRLTDVTVTYNVAARRKPERHRRECPRVLDELQMAYAAIHELPEVKLLGVRGGNVGHCLGL